MGNEFESKRILVTGGTRGIGEAIVNHFVRGGARVIATARSIPAGGARKRFVQADVSTREGVDQVVKTTLDRLGGIDLRLNFRQSPGPLRGNRLGGDRRRS